MQTTIKNAVTFTGVGLHGGAPARVTILPASAETGIWFRRVDVTDKDALVPARWDAVEAVPLCTRLFNHEGVSVSTVEHLMAALAGCGVHNAMIEIDGPEVPILDGSSAPFVQGILSKGIRRLRAPLRAIRVLKPVEVRNGEATARLEPADSLEIEFSIDFVDAAIGHQEKRLHMANGAFLHELCDSRTFCRRADVETMQANGLALGGVPGENAVVFDGDHVLSPGGLRHTDEPVRHKMLDALGDLALASCPILGRYTGIRAGHALTNQLLRALFADPMAYRVVLCDADTVARLPGAGVTRGDLAALAHAA
ncbi:UDP-3-O-acyl-N-acetylglucosamine deacetylase [Psychromarinibacter halotolerans]|uniref:UDP-3-O-acyl-N-acetylglucosamine deacetylase n=1 Tax=Psychromarinibacter halotolerans TaxID=1775175 RepID=A0ABV7GSG6_9RHOB|nr:UDP-3-O-acyl-N-acetylglucosamine deacetylase [Psychromarinibacter halotolerans]MDF0596731.1 UDP-3-O-acyl-N-acetylglucosamine deacetylase [Psychromarinibacter halotolerans]